MPPSAITVNITNTTISPQVANTDTMAIVSHNATWSGKSRTYNSEAAVAQDFAATGPEVAYASAYFAQSPAPSTLKILNALLKPTMQYTIGAIVLRNSDSVSYEIGVAGFGIAPVTVAYTTDSTATDAEIHNGLVTALNAVTSKNYTATFAPSLVVTSPTFTANDIGSLFTAAAHGFNTGDGPYQVSNSGGALPSGLVAATNYWIIRVDANTFQLATSLALALAGTFQVITTNGTGTQTLNHQAGTLSPTLPFLVTGNAAGNWFSLTVLDRTALSMAITHADPGIATDLAAIRAVDSAWFDFDTLYNSKSLVLAAAAWAEVTAGVGYTPQVCDTATLTAAQGNGDTIDALATLNYYHTSPWYYTTPAVALTAAVNGNVLPRIVSATYDGKPIVGVPAVNFTDTEYANLIAKRGNSVKIDGGLTVTFSGICSNGNYFDAFRGDTWWSSDLKVTLLKIKVANDKVPYDDTGISAYKAGCKSSAKRAIAQQIITANPPPVFTFPKFADVNPSDIAARNLVVPNAIQATRSGSIQTITVDVNVAV